MVPFQVVDSSGKAASARELHRCSHLELQMEEGARPPLVFQLRGRTDDPGSQVRHLHLAEVARGLLEAPALFERALHLRPAAVRYRVLVRPALGALRLCAGGEAYEGRVTLTIGPEADDAEVRRIARHEPLHLIVERSMPSARWAARTDTFVDGLVRAIEAQDLTEAEEAAWLVPVSRALAEKAPRRRDRWDAFLERKDDPEIVALAEALSAQAARWAGEAPPATEAARAQLLSQRRQWTLEASFGRAWLAEALAIAREHGLRADLLLDDRLDHFQRTERAAASIYTPAAPASAHELLSREALWPLQLAALGQALQCGDSRFFKPGAAASVLDEVVISQRASALRLYLRAPASSGPVPPPADELRRLVASAEGRRVVDAALHGAPRTAEARVWWARICARLCDEQLEVVPGDARSGLAARVVLVAPSAAARASWESAAAVLARSGSLGSWAPVVEVIDDLSRLRREPARSPLLVFDAVLSASDGPLLERLRAIAGDRPIRGALFRSLEGGAAHERAQPFAAEPRDPRYREAEWAESLPPAPGLIAPSIDGETRSGRLSSPLAHLLSIMRFGVEEAFPSQAS